MSLCTKILNAASSAGGLRHVGLKRFVDFDGEFRESVVSRVQLVGPLVVRQQSVSQIDVEDLALIQILQALQHVIHRIDESLQDGAALVHLLTRIIFLTEGSVEPGAHTPTQKMNHRTSVRKW